MNPADLARLFATEGPRLLRRLRRFRGRVAPEDVVQSAFAKMLEADVAEIEEPRAYLARIARNLAIDEIRRRERSGVSFVSEAQMDRHDADDDLTPEEMLIEGERFAYMMAVVLALPEKERLALVMFKLKGLSHAEIGRRLGVSQHNVPRYLSRALAKCAAARQAFERAELDEKSDDKRTREPDRT